MSPNHLATDDCWNRIGVRGDGSCPELKVHVHCRNCPVFSAGAGALLDRELPPGYQQEWTRHFAQPARVEESNTHSAVIFRVGAEWLALPTAVLEEVAEQRAVHSLPHLRGGAVLGLVNVRGELLVCVSLAALLGVDAGAVVEIDARRQVHRRLLVIRYDSGRAVLPTDEVYGIHRYHPRELRETPATVSKAAPNYTRALLPWREQTVGLLDDARLCHALDRSLSLASAI
jgi:chemotaxis-related protein WspD